MLCNNTYFAPNMGMDLVFTTQISYLSLLDHVYVHFLRCMK